MTNRVHIICHEQAGGGRGKKTLEKTTKILREFGLEFLVYPTSYSQHTHVITDQVIHKGYQPFSDYLMVIGGDGTLHEVVERLIFHQRIIPVSYIPAGTGNDFARNFQQKLSNRELVERMLFSRQAVQLPVFTYTDLNTNQTGIILNNMGFGIDGQANAKAQKMQSQGLLSKGLLRSLSYLVGLVSSLTNLPKFSVSAHIDGRIVHLDQVSLATILNVGTLGGGIRIDSQTQADRSEIAVILYHSINWPQIPSLLWQVLVKKDTAHSPHINRFAGQSITFIISDGVVGHVDGEIMDKKPVQLQLGIQTYPFYL